MGHQSGRRIIERYLAELATADPTFKLPDDFPYDDQDADDIAAAVARTTP